MKTDGPTYTAVREVPIDSLIVEPLFAGLFIEDPGVVARITASIKRDGYDEARPVDIWADGAGPGRHVLIEGHQRHRAAKTAGQETIRAAYRHFDNQAQALIWAAEQQANRRNATKEAQCLSVLRALRNAGEAWTSTPDMSERFGFSTATIDRARQVLDRGTESEVVAVLEGTHGLKAAYAAILKREREEKAPFDEGGEPKPAPRGVETQVQEALDRPAPEEPEDDAPPELEELRKAFQEHDEASGRASDLFYNPAQRLEQAGIELRSNVIEGMRLAHNKVTEAWERYEASLEPDEAPAGTKRCVKCDKVKPLEGGFKLTKSGDVSRRARGGGEWCQECADAPDPTTSAAARRRR
jgi:ParB-like chromosome segregation protein Spo0J